MVETEVLLSHPVSAIHSFNWNKYVWSINTSPKLKLFYGKPDMVIFPWEKTSKLEGYLLSKLVLIVEKQSQRHTSSWNVRMHSRSGHEPPYLLSRISPAHQLRCKLS